VPGEEGEQVVFRHTDLPTELMRVKVALRDPAANCFDRQPQQLRDLSCGEHAGQAVGLRLKLDTTNREPIDFEAESGKFRNAWHHAAGARGGVVRALRRQKVAA
jgi:hypothetical protein